MIDNKKGKVILLIIAIIFLSMSIILSISIWNNRSFFFDEYVYSRTNYSHYVKLIYESVKNHKNNKSELLSYSFVYYNFYIEGKWYSNLPGDRNIIEDKNIVSVYVKEDVNKAEFFSNENSKYTLQGVYDEKVDEIMVEGHIYVDMSNNLLGTFQFFIRNDLKLQSLLYIECMAFLILASVGLILLFRNFKVGQAYISNKLEYIPIDIKLIILILSIVFILLLIPTYIKTLRNFTLLRSRIISFGFLTILIANGLLAFLDILNIIRPHGNNYIALKDKWDNRYFRLPVGLSCFIFLITLYISMLYSFKMFESFSKYTFIRENIFILSIYFSIVLILSFIISKIIKAKDLYTDVVLSEIKEMAEGNLTKDIAVVGNDKVSNIAENVNLIKNKYIEAIEEQKKSERLKYELITNISHDLRSPLTSIINYLDLSKALVSEGELKRYINAAESNSKVLHLLIEDLFELSKMESGNVKLSKVNIDLILLLKQVVYEYNTIFREENKEVILSSSLNEIEYFCDNLSISRLFNNLIDNAIKYSLPNTRIYIDVNSYNNELQVEIKNVSSYKLDFNLEELFLRFKRGDKSRTTEGTGLGLAIAKGIAVLHGGNIKLKNDGDLFKAIVILPRK